MIEIWKPIKGYEGLYEVSNFGQVKSLSRIYYSGVKHTTIKTIREYIMSPRQTKTGYLRVCLCNGDSKVDKYIHQLVAIEFILNINDYTEINHKNEDKSDNSVTNLEWCNHLYNCNYGTRNEKVSIANKEYRKRCI